MQVAQEKWVQSLGWEDFLEEEMYSCLDNPMDRGACYSPWGQKESDTIEQLKE